MNQGQAAGLLHQTEYISANNMAAGKMYEHKSAEFIFIVYTKF